MSAPRFDRLRVQAFLELAGDRLDGDWLLIGGGAAAAWFAPLRERRARLLAELAPL